MQQPIGTGLCLYNAGTTATPRGELALDLDAVSPLHGTLAITQYVLQFPSTDCGDDDTESLQVTF